MAQTESVRGAGAGEPSLGDLVSLAVKDLSQLVKWEIDLAKMELKADAKRLGLASAMFGIGAFIGCLVLVLLCFALAYGLMALGIWSWAAFLIVAGLGLVLIGVVGLIALVKMRKLSGLRRTRTTVQADLALMHRDEEAPGTPAVEAR
jgi:MFS family permease